MRYRTPSIRLAEATKDRERAQKQVEAAERRLDNLRIHLAMCQRREAEAKQDREVEYRNRSQGQEVRWVDTKRYAR